MTELYIWIGSILAGLALLLGTYFKGKATGAHQERQEQDAAVAKQQSEARAAVREVENEINRTNDAGILDRAAPWVRKPGAGGD